MGEAESHPSSNEVPFKNHSFHLHYQQDTKFEGQVSGWLRGCLWYKHRTSVENCPRELENETSPWGKGKSEDDERGQE